MVTKNALDRSLTANARSLVDIERKTVTDMKHRVWLGAYQHPIDDPFHMSYTIFVGAKADLGRSQSLPDPYNRDATASLASLKLVPRNWTDDLRTYLNKKGSDPISSYFAAFKVAPVGSIDYFLSGRLAITADYDPRSFLGIGPASGLPYYMEAITASIMRKHGAAYAYTSQRPSSLRVDQLKKVGLPASNDQRRKTDLELLEGSLPISEWLRGLGRGIKLCVDSGSAVVDQVNGIQKTAVQRK